MAPPSPQLEDGYTRIANEIMEALAQINLSPYESRALWLILRKTYGWKKKVDWIASSQFRTGLKLDRRNTFRALQSLVRKNLILVSRDDGGKPKYSFQKDHSKWRTPSRETTDVIGRDDKGHLDRHTPSSEETHTKETLTKDDIANPSHSSKISRIHDSSKRKSTVTGFKETVALYFELFTLRFGAKPDFDGVDGNLLSGLIAKHGADQVQALLRFFFEHPPAWVLRDLKFTIPAFKRTYTELIAQFQNGTGVHQRGRFVG